MTAERTPDAGEPRGIRIEGRVEIPPPEAFEQLARDLRDETSLLVYCDACRRSHAPPVCEAAVDLWPGA